MHIIYHKRNIRGKHLFAHKIVLDAGHYVIREPFIREDSEKADTLTLTMAAGEILKEMGLMWVYLRTEDIYQTPFEKENLQINRGDYFISFHRNSSPRDNWHQR